MSGTMRWRSWFAGFAVVGIGWGLALGQASGAAQAPGGTGQNGGNSPDGGMRSQSVATRDPALAASATQGTAAAPDARGASLSGQADGAPMPGQEMAHMRGARKTEPSTALTLTIGGRTVTLRPEDLERMPQRTVSVHNAHLNADEVYTGVALGDLLSANGAAATDAAGIGRMLRSYVRATGSDGYFVLYSGVEVESGLHAGDVIVATRVGGRPLGEDGRMKLVSSEDKRPARWVRNLMGISVSTVE